MDMTPVPPGLEYLTQLDQVLVQQKMEACEIFSGCEMSNKYLLKNSMGQQWLRAEEDTNCCNRQCCGPARSFEMLLLDNNEQEIVHLSRPLACASCCCPCCLQSLEVQCPPGNPIGSVHQEWSICTPIGGKFAVQNAGGDVVLRIQGPVCLSRCCGDVVFQVTSPDGGVQVGQITKQWRGCCAESFTDADNFGVSFPMNLEVRTKTLLLGAMFLIDFMYFEQKN